MKIWGKTGANDTGVTVDGFELGRKNNIVVGTSIPHDTFTSNEEFENYDGGNNIYIALVDKETDTPSLKWLTSYSGDTNVRNLELIKISDDRFALLYGLEKNEKAESTCCKLIDSSGNVLQSNTLEKPFYCTSEPSIEENVLTWCHYTESGLGNFLIMDQWDLETGSFRVFNLDMGIESKISKIEPVSGSYVPVGTYEVQMKVYSDLFQAQYPTAPVIWESSDSDEMEVLNEETVLSGEVWNKSYQVAATKIKRKTNEPVTLTCRVGSKTGTLTLQAADPGKEEQNTDQPPASSNGNDTSEPNQDRTQVTNYKDTAIGVKPAAKANKPKKATLKKVESRKKGTLKLTWKRNAQAAGYQAMVSTDKKFKKSKKTALIKKNKTVTKTFKN